MDGDEQSKSKVEGLRDDVSGLENKIMSLQQVRQELMNKQMAELDHFGNLGGQQTGSIFGAGQQRSLLDYFGASGMGVQGLQQQLAEISVNIENMKKDTGDLDDVKAKLSNEIHTI